MLGPKIDIQVPKARVKPLVDRLGLAAVITLLIFFWMGPSEPAKQTLVFQDKALHVGDHFGAFEGSGHIAIQGNFTASRPVCLYLNETRIVYWTNDWQFNQVEYAATLGTFQFHFEAANQIAAKVDVSLKVTYSPRLAPVPNWYWTLRAANGILGVVCLCAAGFLLHQEQSKLE